MGNLIPEQASTFAPRVDMLYYALWAFLIVFTVGVTFALVYFGIKYRQKLGTGRRSVHIESLALELTWTLIPTVIAICIFAWGATLYYDYANVPANTLDISVIGKRWMWKTQHPNGLREVNELHVPVNTPVKLTMTSQDVLHSFYIPAFRVKQDTVPGVYTTMWFEATKTGTFPIFCAEYCGTEHSTMGGTVTVMTPAEYEQWLEGGPAETPAARGEAMFQNLGCITCHAQGSTQQGPLLNDIFGTDVRLQNGETVKANEEYIAESILEPNVKVVEGYAPLMPSFKGQLDEDDVMSLVAYIKSLKTPIAQ